MLLLQIVPRPIVLPGPLDTLLPFTQGFGENLRRIFNPQGVARDEFRAGVLDGTIDLVDVARQVRAADNDATEIMKFYNLDPDDEKSFTFFEGSIMGFPETFEQQLETGLAAKPPEGELSTADLEVERIREEAKAGASEGIARKAVADAAVANDVAGLEAELRAILAKNGITEAQYTSREFAEFVQAVGMLSPGEKRRYLMSKNAAGYLADIQHRESLELRAYLAQLEATAKATPNAAEKLKLALDFRPALTSLITQIREAEEAKDERALNILGVELARLEAARRQVFTGDPSFDTEFEQGGFFAGVFGGEGRRKIVANPAMSPDLQAEFDIAKPRIEKAVELAIAEGANTPEEVLEMIEVKAPPVFADIMRFDLEATVGGVATDMLDVPTAVDKVVGMEIVQETIEEFKTIDEGLNMAADLLKKAWEGYGKFTEEGGVIGAVGRAAEDARSGLPGVVLELQRHGITRDSTAADIEALLRKGIPGEEIPVDPRRPGGETYTTAGLDPITDQELINKVIAAIKSQIGSNE